MRRLLLLVAVAALVSLPASATAQAPLPQGDSGIDQYAESVPGSGGDRPTEKRGQRGNGSTLPPGVRSTLDAAQGPLGAAAADLAEATAPDGGGRLGRSEGGEGEGGDGNAAAATAASEGSSGVASVLDALFGGVGGGMGIALPIILAAGLGAALLALLVRRRRGGDPAPPA